MANILVELHQLVICYYRELNCIEGEHRIENWIQFMQSHRRHCGPRVPVQCRAAAVAFCLLSHAEAETIAHLGFYLLIHSLVSGGE